MQNFKAAKFSFNEKTTYSYVKPLSPLKGKVIGK